MLQTETVEKIETHILHLVKFSQNRAVYEIMWTNTAEPGKPQMTRRLTRISRRIPKATNAHSEYVILIAFPLQQWLHERYTYIACLVSLQNNPPPPQLHDLLPPSV